MILDGLILYEIFSVGMFIDGTFSDGMFSNGIFSDVMFYMGTKISDTILFSCL